MTYLITGGTGTFGKAYTNHLLKTTEDKIVIFSRDEFKQWEMRKNLNSERVKFIIGDVRSDDSIFDAVEGVDRVVHAAALKHVYTGEAQPAETIKTNVVGTQNVLDACDYHGAKMVLLSTDKAVQPINLYGCTKMCAEKITLNVGHKVVRYGNVFGSRGSILHIFKSQASRGDLFTITDMRMTRFVVTIKEACEIVDDAFKNDKPVTLPSTIRGIRIVDLAYAFDDEAQFSEIGIQKGEKLHELLDYKPLISSEYCDKMSVEEIRRLIDEAV